MLKIDIKFVKLKLHVQKDEKLEMDFIVDRRFMMAHLESEIYLTENKKTGFIAEISSGNTVAEKATAIQAWKKLGFEPKEGTNYTFENTMTFRDTIELYMRDLTLISSKFNPYRQTQEIFRKLFPKKVLLYCDVTTDDK